MTESTSPQDAALDRWLAEQFSVLLRDISVILDIESGLRDAMLPGRYTSLVSELGDVLDVERGLAAIVPTPIDQPLPPTPLGAVAGEHPSIFGGLQEFVRLIESAGIAKRLQIRNDPVLIILDRTLTGSHPFTGGRERNLAEDLHNLALRVGVHPSTAIQLDRALANVIHLMNELTLLFDSARAILNDLNVTLDAIRYVAGESGSDPAAGLALDPPRARALMSAQAFVQHVGGALGLAHAVVDALLLKSGGTDLSDRILSLTVALDRAHQLAQDLPRARELFDNRDFVKELVSDLLPESLDDIYRALDPDRVRDLTHGIQRVLYLFRDLGDAQSALHRARHDFMGADLRTVDLTGVSLEALRWSITTLWPSEWEEQIKRDSVEVAPGIFEIRGGTTYTPVPTY